MYQLASISNTSRQRCHRERAENEFAVGVAVISFTFNGKIVTPKCGLYCFCCATAFKNAACTFNRQLLWCYQSMVALVMTILYTLYTVACATDPVSYKSLFSVSKLYRRRFDFSGTLRISPVGVVPRKKFWMVLLCSSMFPTINCEFVVFELL